MDKDWYEILTHGDPIWNTYAFRHVTVASHDAPELSILGICYSKYPSGPSLFVLADTAGQLTGVPGHYGLKSCEPV
jgi:hypothetical protein